MTQRQTQLTSQMKVFLNR